MANIYLFSGPCGCGKSTLTAAFARHLERSAYLIHGDDFQAGFAEPEDTRTAHVVWEDILRFNWRCILNVARSALEMGLDVVIDYVVEDELPLVKTLANDLVASLYYIVLTSSPDILRQRLQERGDAWLIERALFLKDKLDSMPENQGHLFDITGMTVEQEIAQLQPERFIV